MTITQIILEIFILFALSRAVLRFKSGQVSFFGLLFWCGIFGVASIIVLFPGLTTNFARTLGIGRGVDAVIYISIVILFYLVFRLYVFIQTLRHEITELVQKLALKDKKDHDKKTSAD